MNCETPSRRQICDRRVAWVLRLIGMSALLAFGASIMPNNWIVEASEYLGFDPFPDSPLTYYLARNLSLMYGFTGVLLLIVANDLPRYRPIVRFIWAGTVAFAVLQWVVDSMAELPSWWVYGESMSTLAGGLLIAWLDQFGASSD